MTAPLCNPQPQWQCPQHYNGAHSSYGQRCMTSYITFEPQWWAQLELHLWVWLAAHLWQVCNTNTYCGWRNRLILIFYMFWFLKFGSGLKPSGRISGQLISLELAAILDFITTSSLTLGWCKQAHKLQWGILSHFPCPNLFLTFEILLF